VARHNSTPETNTRVSRDCNPEELPQQRLHLGTGPGTKCSSLASSKEASPAFSWPGCPLQHLLPLLGARLHHPSHTPSCWATKHCSSRQPAAVSSLQRRSRAPVASTRALLPCAAPQSVCLLPRPTGPPAASPSLRLPWCWRRGAAIAARLVPALDALRAGLSGGLRLLIGRCQAAVRKLAAKLLPAPTFPLLSLTSSLFINCPAPNRLPPMWRCSYYAGSICHLPSKVTSSRMSCKPD